MGINKYKVFPASSIDSLDTTKLEESVRYNLDGTQFIAEFKVEPHGNTIVLTHEEATALMQTAEWQDSSND